MTTKDATTEKTSSLEDRRCWITWRDMYRFLDVAYQLGRQQTVQHITRGGEASTEDTAAAAFRIWFNSDQLPISPWSGGVPENPKEYFFDPFLAHWRGGERDE